mgnify:CR=1 FL=1
MEAFLRLFALAVYLTIGTWLAYRWVVSISGHESGWKRNLGKFSFVFVWWAGAFILGFIQTRISVAYFDPADFPDDRGLSAEVAFDGVGNNVTALFLGWIFPLICIAIAEKFEPEPAAGSDAGPAGESSTRGS